MNSIEDLTRVTSPLRHYVKLDMSQLVGFFGLDPEELRYVSSFPNGDYGLIDHTPEIEAKLRERATELGMVIRFREEYWPRLEESWWRKVNGISEY